MDTATLQDNCRTLWHKDRLFVEEGRLIGYAWWNPMGLLKQLVVSWLNPESLDRVSDVVNETAQAILDEMSTSGYYFFKGSKASLAGEEIYEKNVFYSELAQKLIQKYGCGQEIVQYIQEHPIGGDWGNVPAETQELLRQVIREDIQLDAGTLNAASRHTIQQAAILGTKKEAAEGLVVRRSRGHDFLVEPAYKMTEKDTEDLRRLRNSAEFRLFA